jgi:23S rRNA (cytosine1962-C5)-methyltransferase
VLDPPALAKRGGGPQGLTTAAAAYKELVLRGARLTRAGRAAGRLLVFGARDARALGRDLRRRDRRRGPVGARARARGAGRDHPELVGVPETSHLKVWTFRVL